MNESTAKVARMLGLKAIRHRFNTPLSNRNLIVNPVIVATEGGMNQCACIYVAVYRCVCVLLLFGGMYFI